MAPEAFDALALALIETLDETVLDQLAAAIAPRLGARLATPVQLLTTREAARIVGMHPSSLARAAVAGRVAGAQRVGRYWRFDPSQLNVAPPAPRHAAAPAPSLGARPATPGKSPALAAMRQLHERPSRP